ncbi:FAD-dependent oxidoreductase [Thermoleophilia bacterium SCSIO 60948]|nr:FAD-dependent oxidoreductase [Thermoleophilia bacterium SCSIO 60948]
MAVTVIVGSGPAAVSAAEGFRENGGAGPVLMLAAEPHAPYERPPLSKEFLRGEAELGDIALRGDGWATDFGVAIETSTAVVALDPANRTLSTVAGDRIEFERCLLATGARPARPPLPGVAGDRVAGLRTPADSGRLAAWAAPEEHVAVVGSGFIGCEAAVSLAARGARVTLLSAESSPQAERLGSEAAAVIAGWLVEGGVELRMQTALEAIERGERERPRLRSDGAEALDCDAVLLALGVERNTELARAAGLEVGDGILTDPAMRTSAPGVWAAGDVAEATNATLGEPLLVEHWGEALDQGAVAGASMAGAESAWDSVPGFWSVIGERTLKYGGWGQGFDEARFDGDADGFSVEYLAGGELVGVLAHERDDAYEHGRERIAEASRSRR